MPRDLLAEGAEGRDLLAEESPAYKDPIAPFRTGFQQGLTFGFGDEMGAALRAGAQAPFSDKSFTELYQQHVESIRAEQRQAREQSPGMAFAGDVVGGATQGGILGKGVSGLKGLTALGAAEGALYGAGTAEGGLVDRAKRAGIGGAIGALAPVPAHYAVKLAGSAGRSLVRSLANTPRRQADRVVGSALAREGITPDEALLRLQELGPDARLADIVPETARAATAIPGPARQVARDFLEQRQAGQQGRLLQAAGLSDVPEFKRAFSDLMRNRQSAAAPLYQEAYETPLDLTSPGMQALLQRPTVRQAIREGQRILQDEGGGGGHVRVMDAAVRHIGDKIGAAMRSGARDEVRRLTLIKHALLNEVDDQVPAFAKARGIYAGEAAMRDAGQLGRKMFAQNIDLDDVELRLMDMGAAERTSFQMGALRGMVDKLERASNTRNTAQKLIESPRSREVLRLAFPDDESVERLIRTAEAESQFSRTRSVVRGGSPTARIQEEVADLRETAGIIASLAKGKPVEAAGMLMKKLGIGKVSDETLGEVAKILFDETPNQLTRGPLRPPPIQRLPPGVAQGAAVGATGAAVTE